MTRHDDGLDAASVEVLLHMTQSGGIGNLKPRGSNEQKKRSLAPLNKVFKLWNRQKHASSKETLAPRSGLSPNSHRSPSSSCSDSWPEKHSLLPPFSPAHQVKTPDCNLSSKSRSSSTESYSPPAFTCAQEFENPRLRSHKSLGTIPNGSTKSLHSSKLNHSTKCLQSSAMPTPLNSAPLRVSKEETNQIEYYHRSSSDKTNSGLRRDDPQFIHDPVSLSSPSNTLTTIPPRSFSRDKYPKLLIAAPRPNLEQASPSKGSCSCRGESFDFVTTPTYKNYPPLPAKSFMNHEFNKSLPALGQHHITRCSPVSRKEIASFAKKMPQIPRGLGFRAKLHIPWKSSGEGSTSPSLASRDLMATDESQLPIPTHVRNLTMSDTTPSTPSSILSGFDVPSPNHHYLYPTTRNNSTTHFRKGSGKAESDAPFKDMSPQLSGAEDLLKSTKIFGVRPAGDVDKPGQEDGVVHCNAQNYITDTRNGVVRDGVGSCHTDINPTRLPFRQSTLDTDSTASTFESEVDDEIEDVQFILGSRIVYVDPPSKVIIQDLQSTQLFPHQNSNDPQTKSPKKKLQPLWPSFGQFPI